MVLQLFKFNDMEFRTPFNGLCPDPGEFNSLPSLTVPDESLTVRELFERYAIGAPLGVSSYSPVYPDGDDPGFDDYDPLESGAVDLVDFFERNLYESTMLSAIEQRKRERAKDDDAPKGSSEADDGGSVESVASDANGSS